MMNRLPETVTERFGITVEDLCLASFEGVMDALAEVHDDT